jgi:hypothetical protein
LGATAFGLTGALGFQCSGGVMTADITSQLRTGPQGSCAENSSCDTCSIQEDHMSITQLSLQRLSITSANSFEAVVATFEAAIGHPNMADFGRQMRATKTYAAVVQGALGPSGFMEFARYDLGAVMRKEQQHGVPKSVRFVIGNPLIMKEMVKRVPCRNARLSLSARAVKRAVARPAPNSILTQSARLGRCHAGERIPAPRLHPIVKGFVSEEPFGGWLIGTPRSPKGKRYTYG